MLFVVHLLNETISLVKFPIPDIDECSYYNRLCGQNAKCVNTAGGYSCKCDRGFKREGGRCGKGNLSIVIT